MQTENWQDYKEAIDQLARTTLRKWMVGIELEDIRQELWSNYFEHLLALPTTSRKERLTYLRKCASDYKVRARETVYHRKSKIRQLGNETALVGLSKKWGLINVLWSEFLLGLSADDRKLLKMVAMKKTRAEIASSIGIHPDTVSEKKVTLLAKFKEIVENDIQTS